MEYYLTLRITVFSVMTSFPLLPVIVQGGRNVSGKWTIVCVVVNFHEVAASL
jgi:hypothetical protein